MLCNIMIHTNNTDNTDNTDNTKNTFNKYKYKQKFKSCSDINNYNNLLSELDSKHSQSDKNYIEFKKPRKIIDPNVYQEVENTDVKCCTTNKLKLQIDLTKINTEPIEEIHQIKTKVNINHAINNISDLLKLIELYPDDKTIEYNINMHCLHKIKEPLTELNNMIGMKNIKENIVDQIIFYIQNLHLIHVPIDETVNKKKQVSNDFLHTVIYGSPGTGKTELAKIMGSIFSKMGILSKGTFKKVTRADLIAGYLGQTAIKTKDVIKDSLGGVLFIDEAYSLGNTEKRDSFSKECIDTLCEALSDHKDNLMVIIAGYEVDLNDCFFNYNQGLNSRFTWRFKIDDYSATDLHDIFLKKINDCGWSLLSNNLIDVKWFDKNKGSFKFYGRDIETLFAKTKIAHSRRVFCLDASVKKKLTLEDINKGLDIYLKNENTTSKKKDEENMQKMLSYMYM